MLAFIQANLQSILTILGGILAWVVARPWMQAKTAEAEQFVQVNNLQLAEAMAVSVAQRIYQDTVRTLQGTPAWTDEMKRQVLNNAVGVLKAELTLHGVEIAEAVLPGLIQKAVTFLKSSGKDAGAAGA
jgi:hypothetical protein